MRRYIDHAQEATTLTVTAPVDNTAVSDSPLTVSGTAAPGNTVDVLVTNTDANMAATAATTTAAPDGSFSVSVPITGGVSVVNVAATSASGATAHATRTVVFDFVPGTVLLDVTDPDGDDNGPGNYAYATFGDFKPGAWDMQRFQVLDDGTNIIFRVQNRNQYATFGSPLGAQLVDVYVHDPAAPAGTTSTDPSHPFRNFAIAANSAWSKLIQVQGFGQRYENAAGTTLGTVSIRANALVALHHVQRAEVVTRPARSWMGLHRRAHRPGRLQPRPGPQLRGDTAGLRIRCLRHGQRRPALHGGPEHGAEGDRRAHTARARNPTNSTTRSTARSRSRQ